jgi:hypothetical protein
VRAHGTAAIDVLAAKFDVTFQTAWRDVALANAD